MEENIEINIKEFLFIIQNAELQYNMFIEMMNNDEMTKIDGDPLFVLIAMSLLAVYRKTNTVEIKDELLWLYKEVVEAIINEDEKYIEKVLNMLRERNNNDL